MSRQMVTCVLVGDEDSGKDDILKIFLEQFKEEEVSKVNDKYILTYLSSDIKREMCILSISGLENNKKRRQLCYWDASVFVVCFSLQKLDTLQHLKEKWIQEIQEFILKELKYKVPILIVGTEKDFKGVSQISAEEQRNLSIHGSTVVTCGTDLGSISEVFEVAFSLTQEETKTFS